MSEISTPPSMLPSQPPEPVYVRAIRARLKQEIDNRRRVERENFRLRTELKRLTEKFCQHLSGRKR
jgi:hypothetical protein